MRSKKVVIFATILLPLFGLAAWFTVGYAEVQSAESAWNSGDYSNAVDSYARAARLFFWRDDLKERAGLAAASNGDPATAIRHLEHAHQLSELGWAGLALSYFNTGETALAIDAYQRGLQIHDSYALHSGLAYVHAQEGDWPAERAALEEMLRLRPEDARAHFRLALLLSFLEPEMALSELALASSLDTELGAAAQTMRAALTAPSSNISERLVLAGRGLGLVQEWRLARAAFEKAIEADAANAEAWAWLGEAKQQIGLDGRVELDKALSLDHTSASVRALRGVYWNRQGKYPQVLAEYLLAAEFEPQNPAWRASIGDAYVKLGDLVSALAAYQRATELSAEQAAYWRLLAIFCAENGVHIEDIGLPAAEKAVELAPRDPQMLDALGMVYFSSGRFANAEKTLLEAIELSPQYFPAHIHLAMNHMAQGNTAAAFNVLTYVRDADKNGPDGLLAERLLAQYFP